MPKFDWLSGYNPVLSWQLAMDKAQEIMDRSAKPGPVDAAQATYDVACMQLWVQIAQVHATNANTEEMKRLISPFEQAPL